MTLQPEALLQALGAWEPGRRQRRFRTLDLHTGGEPFRILLDAPPIPGDTMVAKRLWAARHADGLRRLLMHEPRGHADMYGGILTEPVTEGADLGVLFLHNEGFSTMCGHGILALTTALVETGALTPGTMRIDTPAGPVTATAALEGGTVPEASFDNVPSWAVGLDRDVCTDRGPMPYDLAFGGAFYAFVPIEALGHDCDSLSAAEASALGRSLKHEIAAVESLEHPTDRSLAFLYGVIFTGSPAEESRHSRHLCVFADGEVDRSPTGTGVSARAALLAARGELAPGTRIEIESVTGSAFGVEIVETLEVANRTAVVPRVTGSASITGRHEFLLADDDLFPHGFFLK